MSMLEKFFSAEHAGKGNLFEGLAIWSYENFRNIQGKFPVIFISFANVKETTFAQAREVSAGSFRKSMSAMLICWEPISLLKMKKQNTEPSRRL